MHYDIIFFTKGLHFLSGLPRIIPNTRYLLFCSKNDYDFFEDVYKSDSNVCVFCTYDLEPFHYSTFYHFLKSNLISSLTNVYIITNNPSQDSLQEIIDNLEAKESQNNFLWKYKHTDKKKETYILSHFYMDIFSFPIPNLNLYLKHCFVFNSYPKK